MPSAKSSTLKKRTTASKAMALPSSKSLDESLGYALRRAQLSTYSQVASHLGKFDVRPSHFATLTLIRANPGLTQSVIAAVLSIQKANFVSILDGLEQRGFTERRKIGGDRRSFALYLTPVGQTFVKKVEAAHSHAELEFRARLGEARSKQLLKLLHEFSGAAE